MITFINIAAVIIGPIVAVYIGQWLHVRAEKRKEKMHIFNILMSSRLNGFASFDAVYALNSIDIVFEKERKVRAAWKEYIDRCTVVNPESPTKTELEKMQLATYKLLEEMARCLGYKDKITWEEIQNPYIPRWYAQQLQSQQFNSVMYTNILQGMSAMILKPKDEMLEGQSSLNK